MCVYYSFCLTFSTKSKAHFYTFEVNHRKTLKILIRMTVNQKIAALQKEMNELGFDAYIIPSSDPHQSEYTPDRWKSRAWISGFTGSAGTVVVTKDHAGVWTDGRYFIQAVDELKGSNVELHKLLIPHTPQHLDWLAENLPEGATVGFDGWMFSPAQVELLSNSLRAKKVVLNSDYDLIAKVWEDQPSMPGRKVFEHDVKYAGKTRAEKFAQIRAEIKKQGGTQYLITNLDDIAWLLNLRGYDVDSNPVFVSYLVLTETEAFLFAEAKKFSPEIKAALKNDGVALHPYNRIETYLKKLPTGEKMLTDKASINFKLFNAFDDAQKIEVRNIVEDAKAIKNETEINHFREVMVKDGVALLRMYRWLDQQLKKRTVSEAELAIRLAKFRKSMGDYYGESFDAIVGYKGNGAIIHYHPQAETCADIENDGMLLLDSGGQYFNGTTDITRTTSFTKPTEQQILDFTLVLKGHIALAMAQFPEGTNGVQLDMLCRQHLWRYSRNYGHGTGHGVGFFNSVHEGPQRISPAIGANSTLPFKIGTVTSNEPGIYRSGEYGIRIENLVLCVETEKNDFGKFLKFETITMFPMDQKLIDASLLSKDEKDWLNDYHQTVFDKLSPHLKSAEVKWLKKQCKTIR